MLSRVEFGVLTRLLREKTATQRALAKELGVSLGSLNNAMKQLRGRGFVSQACGVTEQGCQELEKHRVSSAVILAAGTASRFAPLSFEKPRAMFEVRGEVLIERLIRQLKEAGVTDITVVVGYMKEAFFYLEDAFDVHIVVNDEYATRNNNYSLWCGLRSGGVASLARTFAPLTSTIPKISLSRTCLNRIVAPFTAQMSLTVMF